MAYNAEYDRKILQAELSRVEGLPVQAPPAFRKGVEWVDPLVWARELQKLEKSRALGDVVQRLGIVLENAHRAAADAEATLHVFAAFLADARVPKLYGALLQTPSPASRIANSSPSAQIRPKSSFEFKPRFRPVRVTPAQSRRAAPKCDAEG